MLDKTYKISFVKKLLSSDGHPFDCVQEHISVAASTPEEAMQSAQMQFQDHRRIPRWQLDADYIEIVEDREAADSFGQSDVTALTRRAPPRGRPLHVERAGDRPRPDRLRAPGAGQLLGGGRARL